MKFGIVNKITIMMADLFFILSRIVTSTFSLSGRQAAMKSNICHVGQIEEKGPNFP